LLGDGRYAYGRILRDASVAVYGTTTDMPGQPPVGERDFIFTVGIYDDLPGSDAFPVVGHDAFEFRGGGVAAAKQSGQSDYGADPDLRGKFDQRTIRPKPRSWKRQRSGTSSTFLRSPRRASGMIDFQQPQIYADVLRARPPSPQRPAEILGISTLSA
jgi:hypothetical protein